VSRRLERVADQLRAEIARVLREEVADPRARLVSVLRVEVSPDLRNATVYWSRIETPDGAALESVAEGLASAAPFVRRQLARALSLRRMPALEFRRDPSLELGDRTLSVLRELSNGPAGWRSDESAS
jgi:ribosome-binding factor A